MIDDRNILVLDIDDTLYLERDFIRSGFAAVGAKVRDRFGYENFGDQCLKLMEQGQHGNIFDQALKNAKLPCDESTVRGLVEHYRGHKPEITALPDAQALLRSQRPLAFISDGPLVSQQNKAEALGLTRISDAIYLTDAWGRAYWKPHHRAFEAVQQRFSSASKFTYVGDNPKKDFYAPQILGWQTIRIRRPGGLHCEAPNPSDCQPDIEIKSLAELVQLQINAA